MDDGIHIPRYDTLDICRVCNAHRRAHVERRMRRSYALRVARLQREALQELLESVATSAVLRRDEIALALLEMENEGLSVWGPQWWHDIATTDTPIGVH